LQFFDTTAKVLEKLREPQQQRLASWISKLPPLCLSFSKDMSN
jgi:hypothetical protein